jgi:hypothetical protein
MEESGCLLLGRREIERRIDQVGDSLMQAASPTAGTDASRPRFISAAELVRRVQPFLGRN